MNWRRDNAPVEREAAQRAIMGARQQRVEFLARKLYRMAEELYDKLLVDAAMLGIRPPSLAEVARRTLRDWERRRRRGGS